MLKFTYIIFLLPFSQLVAMKSPGTGSEVTLQVKRIIAVANGLQQGVLAQVYSAHADPQDNQPDNQVWVRGTNMERMLVARPKSPSTTHVVVIKNTNETEVLASSEQLEHSSQSVTFGVQQTEGGITVQKITREQLLPQVVSPTVAKLQFDPK